MIRLFACILLGIGSQVILVGGGQIAFSRPEIFVADPRGTTYHTPGCIYVDPGKAMLTYRGKDAAEDSGRHACEHCLNGPAVGPRLTSARYQRPTP